MSLRVEHGEVKSLPLEEMQDSVLIDYVSTEKGAPAPKYWRGSVQPGWVLGWVEH